MCREEQKQDPELGGGLGARQRLEQETCNDDKELKHLVFMFLATQTLLSEPPDIW